MTGPGHALLTAAVATASAVSALIGVSPAAPAQVQCGWRVAAVHVLAELTGDSSQRADELRRALLGVGANKPEFVPARCQQPGQSQSDTSSEDSTGTDSSQPGQVPGTDQPEDGSGGSGGTGPGGSGSDDGATPDDSSGDGQADSQKDNGGGSTGEGTTAADALGWGQPSKVDNFDQGLDGWNIYDGPGHAGNGTRSPSAASVSDGVLTINGTGDGTTAGMAWGDGQQYGRWEGRMKAPKGSPSYNALFLLWPSEENFPVGGEIDFAEITDQSRDKVNLFLHYGADNSQVQGDVAVDATQWNNWAVEWTPKGVTAFLNGKKWWSTTDTSILPPGPMHLCIQLDWFPKGDSETGQMQVDWVKQWSLDGGGSAAPSEAGDDTSQRPSDTAAKPDGESSPSAD